MFKKPCYVKYVFWMFLGCVWHCERDSKTVVEFYRPCGLPPHISNTTRAIRQCMSPNRQSALQWSCLITVSIGDQRCCGCFNVQGGSQFILDPLGFWQFVLVNQNKEQSLWISPNILLVQFDFWFVTCWIMWVVTSAHKHVCMYIYMHTLIIDVYICGSTMYIYQYIIHK